MQQETDASPGTVGDYLSTYIWYDPAGNVIKTQTGTTGAFTKTQYDGLGRPVVQYTGYDVDEPVEDSGTWDAANVVDSTDTIVEQTQTWYDAASNAVATADYQRFPNSAATGALTGADSYVTAAATWYDGVGRTVETVNYGREDSNSPYPLNGFFNTTTGEPVDVSPADGIPDVAQAAPPVPDSSDNYIVAQTVYNSAGLPYETIDNLGRINETLYDAAGRTVRTIQNFDGLVYGETGSGFNADGSMRETDTDHDVTVDYQYDSAGRLVTMTAYDAKGSGNGVTAEATKYIYACPYNGSLQTAVVYSDDTADNSLQDSVTLDWTISESGGDHTETTYDRLGRTVTTTDQRGVVHTYSYDAAGRLSDDAVTNWGSSGVVGESVADIHTSYDDMGRVRSVSSLGTGSPAATRNEVEYIYDGWGNEIKEYQAHTGCVDEGTAPSVQYTYDDGAGTAGVAAYLRLSAVTYPGENRVVEYGYGSAGSQKIEEVVDYIMSRMETISDNKGASSAFTYLGAGTVAVEDFTEPHVKLDYDPAGNNTFSGFDRFGRIADQLWEHYALDNGQEVVDGPVDEYVYAYDRAGNVQSRENVVSENEGTPVNLDESYLYDDLDRLIEQKVNNVTQQTWTLDALGNDLSTGSYNAANEETPNQGSSGYDAAGNSIVLQSGDTAKYDAWNRLVEVDDGSGIVEQCFYDGTGRRIQILSNFSGNTAGTVTDYYHSGQQVVQVDTHDGSGNFEGRQQYVWLPLYVDTPILHDTYNASHQLVATDRLYYTTDANHNVTAVVNDFGVVQERYAYKAYGQVTVYDGTWQNPGQTSSVGNTRLFAGMDLDTSTGLYYDKARWYNYSTGTFVNRDPIGYSGGINLYEYCNDSPLIYTDPTGRVCPEKPEDFGEPKTIASEEDVEKHFGITKEQHEWLLDKAKQIKDIKDLIDTMLDNADVLSKPGMMGALTALVGDPAGAMKDALALFVKPGSSCNQWLTGAFDAINRAAKGDGSKCSSIALQPPGNGASGGPGMYSGHRHDSRWGTLTRSAACHKVTRVGNEMQPDSRKEPEEGIWGIFEHCHLHITISVTSSHAPMVIRRLVQSSNVTNESWRFLSLSVENLGICWILGCLRCKVAGERSVAIDFDITERDEP